MNGESRTDAEIKQVVEGALDWAVTVSDAQISCAVASGQVTLNGRVMFWAQRAHIERAVRVLADVSCLFNRIQVSAVLAIDEPVIEVIGLPSNVRRLDETVARTAAQGGPDVSPGANSEPSLMASSLVGRAGGSR